jgi:hypothetical protein
MQSLLVISKDGSYLHTVEPCLVYVRMEKCQTMGREVEGTKAWLAGVGFAPTCKHL